MARDFDGSADYLTRTGTPIITAYPFTVSAWINIDSFTNSPAVFQFGNSAADDSRMGLYFHTTGQLYASARNGSNIRMWGTTASCSTGTWYNVIGVFLDSTTNVSYIDGVGTGSYVSSATATWPTLGRTAIGAVHRSTASQFCDGRIAEVAVWNAALSNSAGEIPQLVSGMSPLMVRPQSLVAYWPLHVRAGASGDELDWVGGQTLSQVSSPPLSDHPRIIYPRRRIITPYQAAAGSLPTLTALTASNITTSGWRATLTAA